MMESPFVTDVPETRGTQTDSGGWAAPPWRVLVWSYGGHSLSCQRTGFKSTGFDAFDGFALYNTPATGQ